MLPPSGKWSVQPPPWAALDFDNPLLKDVQHVATGSAAFLNRGEYNDSFRTSATPPVPVRQPTGISYNLTGSTGYLATNAGGWVNAKTDWTVYVFGVPRSVSVVSAIATIAEAPGSGTRDRSIQINATGKVVGSTFDTANRAIVSTTSLVLNAPASAALRATSSAFSVFVNGVSDATPVTLTASGFGTYASPELVLGYGGSGTGFGPTLASQFDLSLAVWWSRALTDAELLSIHQNPWQVFKSPRRFIVPESGAVAYTLDTTPGTYNITGSSPSLLANRLVDTTPGAYDLTGADAQTLLGRALDTTPGDYDITGSSPSLLLGRALDTTPGDYDITGSPVDLEKATAGQFVLQTTPGAYNITGFPVELIANITQLAGGGPGKTAKRRGWANERAKFEQSLRTEEVAEQVKAAQRVLKKAQSESAQRLGELVAEYEAARASLDELREQVARIERESRIREEVEVASKVVEIFAREEEEIIAILEIIDEMDSRALLAAVGIAA
jgi:hypothetical protein